MPPSADMPHRVEYRYPGWVCEGEAEEPVLAISMVPALRYPGWVWLAAVLTTPVVL